MIEQVLFYLFAIVSVIAGVLVISGRNPISCAVALIVTLGSVAGLFVLLDAHFVATIQILVYAGAIMVLFVFVIMLLNLGPEDLARAPRFTRFRLAGAVLAGLVAGLLIWNFSRYQSHLAPVAPDYGSLEQVSMKLFSEYVIPFEVVSVLLMAAVVGAVMIAKRDV